MAKKTKTKKKQHRYFFTAGNYGDPEGNRIIFFKQGEGKGAAHFKNGFVGRSWWTFKEMKREPGVFREVSRAEALQIVKHLPE